jgi:hypothetical protein
MRKLDPDRIPRAGIVVVFPQSFAQYAGRCPDDRVLPAVVIRFAMEEVHADPALFQRIRFAGQRLLHHQPEQAPQAPRPRQLPGRKDPFQLP